MGYAYFAQRSHSLPGAAGVSQPCDAGVLVQRKTLASANASSNHGGLTPAALVGVHFRIANVGVFRPDERRRTSGWRKSGWRKPAVDYQPRCSIAAAQCSILSVPNHGGLTPAALVNMRSSIAKIAFSSADIRTANKSGGVSPPWHASIGTFGKNTLAVAPCDSRTTAGYRTNARRSSFGSR
jgi:hypothetical protein